MVSNKSLLRSSSLLASFLVRSVKMQIASLNLANLSIDSHAEGYRRWPVKGLSRGKRTGYYE